jgi:hypothetical protein
VRAFVVGCSSPLPIRVYGKLSSKWMGFMFLVNSDLWASITVRLLSSYSMIAATFSRDERKELKRI